MTAETLRRELEAVERDPEYLVARMRKLRREYGRVFVGPWPGRQRRLNELEDEMNRHERTLTELGSHCLVCFAKATTRVAGRPTCAEHVSYGSNP
jgi:hypothetical protein